MISGKGLGHDNKEKSIGNQKGTCRTQGGKNKEIPRMVQEYTTKNGQSAKKLEISVNNRLLIIYKL